MALDTDTLSQFLDALDRFVKERLIPYEDRVADEFEQRPRGLVDDFCHLRKILRHQCQKILRAHLFTD